MKKYFLTAILSLLVATVFTSCGDNDIIEGTEKPVSYTHLTLPTTSRV